MYDQLEALIDELRKLVGWQATAHRLPSLHVLRAALGVQEDIPYARAGRLMRRELLARIRALDDLQIKLALQVSFGFDMSACDAPTRRTAAMRHLGICKSVESYRRADGAERELLAVLAESLVMQVAA